jgi:hypothetical protein
MRLTYECLVCRSKAKAELLNCGLGETSVVGTDHVIVVDDAGLHIQGMGAPVRERAHLSVMRLGRADG